MKLPRRPALCKRHLDISAEFSGATGPDLYSINLNCDACSRFYKWVNKVWEMAAPKKQSKPT